MKNSFDQIESLIEKEFNLVDEGEKSAIEFLLYLKNLEKTIKTKSDKIKSQAIDAAVDYGRGKHVAGEFIFSTRSTGGRWDFKHLTPWVEKKAEIKKLEDKYKASYKMYENDLAAVDTESGEVVEIPIYTPGGDTLILEGKI
jgi:hypothetical protein